MEKLEKQLGYTFKNKNLLIKALTHPSKNEKNNYEVLEILGDSVLNLIIVGVATKYCRSVKEIEKVKKVITSNEYISKYIINNKINSYLMVSKGVNKERMKLNADIYEAIVGAIYQDGGLEAATKFVTECFEQDIINKEYEKVVDYKSELNNIYAKKHGKPITYEFKDISNNPRVPLFKAICQIDGKIYEAVAKTKNSASTELAKRVILRNEVK